RRRGVPRRGGARAACGAGDRAGRQLLQSGTVRASIRFALGGRDRRRAPAAAVPHRADVPPDVPLRGHVEPAARRRAGLARTAPGDPAARPVRPLCAGSCAFRIVDELLRVDPAAHVFGVRWNLLLAIGGTVAGLVWFARTQRRAPTTAR